MLAWLDTSADEQRRVREIVGLFSQSESRDELGIGQIRDVFSDALFPGTSVIQTRARYFLFVPWIFRAGEDKGLSGDALLRWVQVRERRLVEALRKAGETEGLIGKLAGPAVKVLPSAIYWSGLTRYGILSRGVSADQVARRPAGRGWNSIDAAADELASRTVSTWHPTLPAPPESFPDEIPNGFTLTPDEAGWFRERILASAPDTLLAHLVSERGWPDEASAAPWEDPSAMRAPEPVATLLAEARRFSLTLHGAALLYNLLVAEAYEAADLTRIDAPADLYRELLDEWADAVATEETDLRSWDRAAFWALVRETNPRISPPTRLFVDAWLERICGGGAAGVADDPNLRRLIAERERFQKRGQARLANERLLRAWSGASGAAPLAYRWGQVKRMVTDILTGEEDGDART